MSGVYFKHTIAHKVHTLIIIIIIVIILHWIRDLWTLCALFFTLKSYVSNIIPINICM